MPPRVTTSANLVAFVREGQQGQQKFPPKARLGELEAARDWQMLVDVGQRLTVPPQIAITNLRPDLVLWSNTQCRVYFVELTVPWEDAVEEAFEQKKLRYSDLAAEAEQRGWRAQ